MLETPGAALADGEDDAASRLFLAPSPGDDWLARPVDGGTIERLYELVRMAPTAFNGSPARFVFARSGAARERLAELVGRGNRAKVERAPVTAIVGYDPRFYEALPRLFPKYDARPLFAVDPALAERTAWHSSTIQAAYLILAARALGLDAAPMSGFDAGRVEAAFFPGEGVRVNLLCCLGYADRALAKARNPRLAFEEACRVV